MNLNKDPESWARVDPTAVVSCSHGHAVYVLTMAKLDIAKLAAELESVSQDRNRIARNRDMWKGQCERQAEQLRSLALPLHNRN
jgi:hypothetical protein